MGVDVASARAFVTKHARLLDRRRFELAVGGTDRTGVLAALEGYRNDDGGYGWGLESDLRSPESQPGAALHAFEAFAEAAPETSPHAVQLCDWLASITLADGGVPFALPIGDPTGCAPWWMDADQSTSALQITSIVTTNAHHVAEHDAAVAGHDWLRRATDYCLDAIEGLDEEPHAFILVFGVRFLDQISAHEPRALPLLKELKRLIPDDGLVHVEGGTETEFMRPLDFAPAPGRPARDLFEPDVIESDLDRLAGEQQDDGGWPWAAATFSPASALEWRAYVTVAAVQVLAQNGRLT